MRKELAITISEELIKQKASEMKVKLSHEQLRKIFNAVDENIYKIGLNAFLENAITNRYNLK